MRYFGYFIVGLCLMVGGPSQAQWDVDLELVLLADSTGSIDDAEILFQRQGYATAITDPSVISAIRHTAYGRIAVTYVEWGDFSSQEVVVGWTMIGDVDFSRSHFAAAYVIRSSGPVRWVTLLDELGRTDEPPIALVGWDLYTRMLAALAWGDWVDGDPELETNAHDYWTILFEPLLPELDGVEDLVVVGPSRNDLVQSIGADT